MEEQRAYVMRLLDALEVTDRDKRLKVARAILYLAQGALAQSSVKTITFIQKHSVKIHVKMFLLTSFSPGVFDECDTEVDVLHWSRHNVFLLYDMGIFTALLELLSMEIE